MRYARRSEVQDPLIKPQGEAVYELIGAPAALGGASGHSLAEIVIPAGGSSARHRHARSEETYYILCGEGRLVIDGRPHLVRAGDAYLIEVGERHQIFNEKGEELVFLAVSAPPWIAEDSIFD
jgi:mannose-6-phosphate isomerase-like protein (cupin superfamily)